MGHELPERMHSLLARGDRGGDGVLDRTEILRLTKSPTSHVSLAKGLEPGRYGFSDSGFDFDSSSHVDGAIDDLRLAATIRDDAHEIARTFMTGRTAAAKSDLLTAMARILTREQLDDFRGLLDRQTAGVPVMRQNVVSGFGAMAFEAGGRRVIVTSPRDGAPGDLEGRINGYRLPPDDKRQALEALGHFSTHVPGRLNDAERTGLVERLGELLNDEQRDDLRAALARRPIVQLSNRASVQTLINSFRVPGVQGTPDTFIMQDLVLRPGDGLRDR